VTAAEPTVRFTNLDKVLYPAAGFTKGDVIAYYDSVADTILPHLHDRPLTLRRFPEGVDGPSFYEKECPSYRPAWVPTASVQSTRKRICHCLAQDRPSLLWLANLAAIEMHPTLAHWQDIQRPTKLTFDLDPGPPADVTTCARVACLLRDVLAIVGLASFPKTSGSKGLQVEVPLNTPVTYEATKPFAKAVAQLLEREHPDLVVSRMAKALRGGKVLIDWSQNDDVKTTVAAYSLRARQRPTVSTPVTWEEVEEGDARSLTFEAGDLPGRIDALGDLARPVLELEQALPAWT
jgi:bifunctional non-homologous end joining protein LigD